MRFSSITRKKLGFYVYALIDPRSECIFYVGKANANNRAFDHLSSNDTSSEKNQLIREIRQSNLQPKIEIIRYGLNSEKECLEVEAAIIDAIGLENLTNVIRGHGVHRGRQTPEALERLYGSKPIDLMSLSNSLMLFFINKTYSPTLSEQELYDVTRQFWYEVSVKTRTPDAESGMFNYPVALAIADSVVIRAYSVAGWFPAGTTHSSRKSFFDKSSKRWEFVGQIIEDHYMLGRRLQHNGEDLMASQKGYRYIN